MSLFRKIARSCLNSIFDDVVKGQAPSSWHTFLHRLMAGGPELFRTELMRMVEERSADEMMVFLRALKETGLKDWIPAEFFPRLVFLDLKYCQRSKRISKMSVLISDGLLRRGEAKSLTDPNGLNKLALGAFLERVLPAEPFTFVGHNFIPTLKASGLSWNSSVLDSRELSLLTYPTQSSHSLGEKGSTGSLVELTFQRMEKLDRVWMKRPIEQVRLLHSNLEEGEVKDYFSWVLFRRPRKNRASIAVEEYLGKTDMTEPALPSVDVTWLAKGRPGELCQHTLSTDHAFALWANAIQNKRTYAVSRKSVLELRQTIVDKTGCLLVPGTALRDDRCLQQSVLLKECKDRAWDFTLAFLAFWKRAGGAKVCELPSCLQIASDPGWKHLFRVAPTPANGILEHCLWLTVDSSTEAVFEYEEFTESVEPYSHEELLATNPVLTKAVEEFLESRNLLLPNRGDSPLSLLVDEKVRKDATFKKML